MRGTVSVMAHVWVLLPSLPGERVKGGEAVQMMIYQ